MVSKSMKISSSKSSDLYPQLNEFKLDFDKDNKLTKSLFEELLKEDGVKLNDDNKTAIINALKDEKENYKESKLTEKQQDDFNNLTNL